MLNYDERGLNHEQGCKQATTSSKSHLIGKDFALILLRCKINIVLKKLAILVLLIRS